MIDIGQLFEPSDPRAVGRQGDGGEGGRILKRWVTRKQRLGRFAQALGIRRIGEEWLRLAGAIERDKDRWLSGRILANERKN